MLSKNGEKFLQKNVSCWGQVTFFQKSKKISYFFSEKQQDRSKKLGWFLIAVDWPLKKNKNDVVNSFFTFL